MGEGRVPASVAALVGAWRLERWQLRGPEGLVEEPFGPHPRGLLLYSADGHMSVVISAPERPTLPDDPAARSVEAQAAAYATVHAYAGRYRLEGDVVVHAVQVATLPAYEGAEQRRRLRLEGDRLILRTPPGEAAHLAPGSPIYGELTWRRVEAAAGAD